jgi:flagellar biosynthetic protein FliQ
VTPELAVALNNQMLFAALLIALPVLGLSMLVGLVISILQVVTQVQDVSLTFVPKMLAAALALVVFGPWMLRVLIEYARSVIGGIPVLF